MSRQRRATASTDLQLLSHTAPTSSFQVLHENKPETGSDAHTRAVEWQVFNLWKLSENLTVVRNSTSDLPMLFFFFLSLRESQQPHENNQILDTYCVCALSSKVS